MATIQEILDKINASKSKSKNINNNSFIDLMRQISGNPEDATAPVNDTNSIYGHIVQMYTTLYDGGVDYAILADEVDMLQGVYDNLIAINSVYADKTTLDSIYADNIKLDQLFADKAVIDRVYGSITNIDRVHTSIDKLDTVYASVLKMDIVADNIADVNIVADSMTVLNEIYDNRVEIYAADENAAIATTKAIEASNSATIATTKASEASASALAASTASNTSTSKATESAASAVLANTSAGSANTSAASASSNATIATTKASEASVSASNASTNAANASTSASAAAVSASTSATKAIEAATSASTALGYKNDVSTMKLAIETIYDTFDDRFLGTKTTNPLVDNDGNTLLDGALFFDTTTNALKVYDVGTTTWYAMPQIYLNSLLDVQLTSLTTGHILVWNGTKWANGSLSKSSVGLGSVDNTADSAKNVLSATKLATARTINGVSFNGTANITVYDSTKAPLNSAALVNPTINGVAQSGYSGFKNLIINGNFDIWQRGTTAAISGLTYLVDKFHAWHSAGGTLVRSGGAIGYYNSLKVAGSSSGAVAVIQRIEAINSIKLGTDGNSKVTVSMYVKSNVASSGSIGLSIPTAVDNFTTITIAKSSVINITTGWTKVSATFDLDFVYWGGIEFYLQCDSCTDFYTTGWQVENGSVATPFEQRPIGLELMLCQRYYQVINTTFSETASRNGGISTKTASLPTTMRVVPIVIEYPENGSGVAAVDFSGTTSTALMVRHTLNGTAWFRQSFYMLSAEL